MSNQTSTANSTIAEQGGGGGEGMDPTTLMWLLKNATTSHFFGFALIGTILLFGICHQIRRLILKHARNTNIFHRLQRGIHTGLQRFNSPWWFRRRSIVPGHVTLALAYFGIMAAFAFYDRPLEATAVIQAQRFGWLALCNVNLAMFLGLKVTPLQGFAGLSWDYLNIIHRCVGYTTVVLVLLHAIAYFPTHSLAETIHQLTTTPQNIAGIAAGAIILTILLTSLPSIRKRHYELFYASHLLLVAGVIVAIALHRPDFRQGALLLTLNAVLLWAPDKAIRLFRWIRFSRGNYATLIPLPGGATRVTMNRRMKAKAGSSAFLWIPSLGVLQRHPFTLILTEPKVEFVVKAREGFTRRLYEKALKEPGVRVRASVEGPYGGLRDLEVFKKIVLIAGGRGITFAMSIALRWARKRRTPRDRRTLELVWVVRNRAELDWFEGEVAELKANARVTVRLYVTASTTTIWEASSILAQPSKSHNDLAKLIVREVRPTTTPRTVSARSSDSNLQAAGMGRPDVGALIGEAVGGEERVLVAGCGPEGMRHDIRRAVAECSGLGRASVELCLGESPL